MYEYHTNFQNDNYLEQSNKVMKQIRMFPPDQSPGAIKLKTREPIIVGPDQLLIVLIPNRLSGTLISCLAFSSTQRQVERRIKVLEGSEIFMLTMPIDPEEMHLATEIFCAPMTLVINFSLFQYLTTFYFKRRNEVLGRLLIFSAFLGFATLVPFAHPNEEVAGHLNDISETSTALTFLIQIVIVGRDVNRKVRIRSLKFISWLGEVLILIGILVIILNFIEVTLPMVDISMFDGLDNIFEDLSLWFIFIARFYYVVISRGWKEIAKRKKLETTMYLLFVTHEYPFLLLEGLTGTTWEGVQALWNRLTVAFCIILTIQEKLRSITSKQSKLNTNMNTTRGPQEKSIFVSEAETEGVKAPPSKRSKASKGSAMHAPSLKSILPSSPSFRSVKVGSSVLPKLR